MTATIAPRGRTDVQSALIDSATRLFSEHGASAVSVREIAKEARVNHGLVHRHFGSKSGLLKAVLNHLADDVAASVGPRRDDEKLFELLGPIMSSTNKQGHWLRIMARSILDGDDVGSLQDRFPMAERVVDAARRENRGPLDPEARVSFIMSVGLGMLFFAPFIQRATGQDDAQWQNTRAQILSLAMRPSAES